MLLGLLACVGPDYGLSDPDSMATMPVEVEERFTQAALPGVDVLFVIDGTGSMREEQGAFADAASTFVHALDDYGLDWHVGVTTTDVGDDGHLEGEPWIVTRHAEDPVAALAAAVQVGTSHVPPSAGLWAATLALADDDGANHGFRRDDAALHVVFVSDDDDESEAWLGDDPGSAFLATLAAESARTGHVAAASAVVGDSPSGCDGVYGTALPGSRYTDVATASGGRVASICTADFAAVADALGAVAIEWQTVFPLQADPVEGSAVVEVDGARLSSGWMLDHTVPALVFAVPPEPDAVVAIRYLVDGAG